MIVPAYVDPIEVRNRLAELGLEAEQLLRAVKRGQTGRLSCTPNHPVQSGGFYAWSETVCGLREELIKVGWEPSNKGNLPFTISQDRRIAIAVSAGDQLTGKNGPGEKPCTKSRKGPQTASVVNENFGQMNLFPEIALLPEHLETINSTARMTWLLLVHCDWQGNEVRCELSLPVNMDEEGYVDDWSERIILTPFPIDGERSVLPVPTPIVPEINVEIRKRVGE